MPRSERAELRRLLRRHQRDQALVRVTRVHRGCDQLDGYVVGVGRRWVLLASEYDACPDGWTALRLRDIRTVEHGRSARLVKRSFVISQAWPPRRPPFPVDLDSTRGVLESFHAGAPALEFHTEGIDPGVAYFGHLVQLERRRVRLHFIDPDGRWAERRIFRRKDISRVGAGARYLQLLITVAGPE